MRWYSFTLPVPCRGRIERDMTVEVVLGHPSTSMSSLVQPCEDGTPVFERAG